MKIARVTLPLLFLAGCMVGPNYRRPETPMPEEFVEAKDGAAVAVADSEFYQWWKQFNDELLNSLIDEAFKANYDVRLAMERILEARGQYRVQSSYLWPEIDINAIATRSRNSQTLFPNQSSSTTGSFLPTFQNFFLLGFDAIWEMDFFGKFRRGKRAALDQWEATKEDAQNVLITVLSEVAVNYVNIRALQQQIELTSAKIQADEDELRLTQDLFEAGLASDIQVATLISTLESDRATLPNLQTTLKQTVYTLAFLLGRQPEGFASTFEKTGAIPIGLDRVPVGLPSDLLRRRPDVRSAERQLAAATEQVGAAVADLFPHISLTGSTFAGGGRIGSTWGQQSGKLNKLFKHASNAWSIGPNILWDMLDFGKVRGNIDVQNSLQRQALITYEKTVTASLQDVEGALVAYFEEQKRRVMLGEEVAANETALQLTEALFEAGLASELQVLEAKRTLIDSESSLVASDQSLTSDLIALYKALGGCWECSYSP